VKTCFHPGRSPTGIRSPLGPTAGVVGAVVMVGGTMLGELVVGAVVIDAGLVVLGVGVAVVGLAVVVGVCVGVLVDVGGGGGGGVAATVNVLVEPMFIQLPLTLAQPQ
jgi:hypothetical protein